MTLASFPRDGEAFRPDVAGAADADRLASLIRRAFAREPHLGVDADACGPLNPRPIHEGGPRGQRAPRTPVIQKSSPTPHDDARLKGVGPVRFRVFAPLVRRPCPPVIGPQMIENLVFAMSMMIPNEQPATSSARIVATAGRIPTAWEPFRACVVNRESHGNPRAQNPVSSAQGKYQFLDRQWRHGAGWNVYHRLRTNGMPRSQARLILARLQAMPIKDWAEPYQDIAFASVILIPRGWRHWAGGHGCNTLVP